MNAKKPNQQEASPFPTSEHHERAPAGPKPQPKKATDGALDHGIEESFPASDPVSVNVTKVSGGKETGGKESGDKNSGDK